MDKVVTVLRERQAKQGSKWIVEEKFPPNELTLDNFIDSFVLEKWRNERRYNKQYTKYGYYHTRSFVYFDETIRTVYTFKFKE